MPTVTVPTVIRPTVTGPTVTGTTEAPAELIAALPEPRGALSFVTGGDGLVGWGEHARFETTAEPIVAAAEIADWFAAESAGLDIDDRVGLPGSGPVAFVSLGFGPRDRSVAVVPQVTLGRRDGVTFSTVIGDDALRARTPITAPGAVRYSDATMSVAGYTSAVAAAVDRIRSGRLAKVVLAHDLQAWTEFPVDERYLLRALAAAYPTCSTFAVDGLVGASPEMMIRRIGRSVSSRVLAGTRWAEHVDDRVTADLLHSAKDLDEHRYAVDSVAQALAAVADDLRIPEQPHPLVLANLTHLATDITGRLAMNGSAATAAMTALGLAALLHPTAAVGGWPRAAALDLINELEPGPRRRYAAPVGWLDTAGDGEFAIALRCAEIDGRSVRLTAGCGIMAGSDPAVEAREAQIKMVPIRDALESGG